MPLARTTTDITVQECHMGRDIQCVSTQRNQRLKLSSVNI